jgi:uncharacterized protein with HEPN domain
VLGSDFRSDSDVDILVEFESGQVPGFAFAGLQDELSQVFGRTVDLHTPARSAATSARRFSARLRCITPALPQRDVARLLHTREAAEKAIEYTAGRDRSILDSDEMRTLAVVPLIETIGETARAVSDATRTQFPEIPCRQIVGTRDRLIHGCEEVDLDILWTIVTMISRGSFPSSSEPVDRGSVRR